MRPTCAVCRRPVDSFLEVEDSFLGVVRFTVRCHGETESVSLPIEGPDAVRSIDFGRAFEPTNILPPA